MFVKFYHRLRKARFIVSRTSVFAIVFNPFLFLSRDNATVL